ncbi:ankyrin repeat-containing domain protein, partial [Usnea florida]
GETPLISAITTGDDELVRLMLQRGASVEARCADEMTPLMHATNHDSLSILELLLNQGAQIDATTAGWTVLQRAVSMANVPIISSLLAKGGYDEIDDSDADTGWTALLRAATSGQEAIVRLLVEKGADIEAKTSNDATPLICAAEGNYEAVVEILLKSGANTHAEDSFGWKPLHRATVKFGGQTVAQMLLSHGADI